MAGTYEGSSFLGDALKASREFPEDARTMAGRQIRRVQQGEEPADWKPFPIIGSNVREIRIGESSVACRVIYQATLAEIVLVVSAFEKKTQKTPKHEIEKARKRLRAFIRQEADK